MDLSRVIRRPIITERSTSLMAQNWYTFEVDLKARKGQIRQAIEKYFDKVEVGSVKTMVVKKRAKKRRASRKPARQIIWKKAMVQLKKGKIEILPEAPAKKKKVKKEK